MIHWFQCGHSGYSWYHSLTRHAPQDPPKVVIQLFQLLFFLLGDGPSVLQVALSVALLSRKG